MKLLFSRLLIEVLFFFRKLEFYIEEYILSRNTSFSSHLLPGADLPFLSPTILIGDDDDLLPPFPLLVLQREERGLFFFFIRRRWLLFFFFLLYFLTESIPFPSIY